MDKMPQCPLEVTFSVIIEGGKKKLQLLQERDGQGAVRLGREVTNNRDTRFSSLSSEFFFGGVGEDVPVLVYDKKGISFVWNRQVIFIRTEGGAFIHYTRIFWNGEKKESAWLQADWFELGQLVVITGYRDVLDGNWFADSSKA